MSYIQYRIRSVSAILAVFVPMLSAQAADDQAKAAEHAPKAAAQKAQPAGSRPAPTDAAPRPSPFNEQNRNAPRARYTIPAGTAFPVRLAETLDTKHVQAGSRFSATLDAPITVHGRIVVPKGTLFEGHITEAQASGRIRGRGVLALALDSFRLRGTTYRVQTAADVHHSSAHVKRDAALIGGGSALGAAVGAISGVGAAIGAGAGAAAGTTTALITGKRNVKLPVETQLMFSLRNNIDVRG